MMDDTITPEKKLEGAALTAPEGAPPNPPPAAPSEMDAAKAAFAEGAEPHPLEGRLTELEGQVASLTAERDAALAKVKTVQGKTKELRAAAKAADPAPRKLAPIADAHATPDREALRGELADADKVAIAFVDASGHQVGGDQALALPAETWKDHARGLMLSTPVEFSGPGMDEAGYQVAGYVLLIDGKPVAHTARDEPLNVAPGQKVKLENDIFF